MSNKPPRITVPGLNHGAGIPAGYVLGRKRGSGQGPAQLLNINQLQAIGIATRGYTAQTNSTTGSTAASATASLSTSVSSSLSSIVSTNVTQSTSLSQISSSLSGAISTNVGQSTSLSQVSSSLSGAISSTSSLSTAVSTVISGSISAVNSRIDSLSTAGGGGVTTFLSLTDTPDTYVGQALKVVRVNAGETGLEFAAGSVDPGQSTSLSQISSSLSSEISSRASGDTSLSTVISGSISTTLSTAASATASLSTAVGVGGAWALAGTGQTATGVWDQAVDGSKANVDFVGLAGKTDILVYADGVTKGTTGLIALSVSTDNGATFFTASGDYLVVDTAGSRSATTGAVLHTTNATLARNGMAIIYGCNVAAPKVIQQMNANAAMRLFVASNSAINAIRLNGSGGGDLTGGKIYCLAR